jgi:hypothetical protein
VNDHHKPFKIGALCDRFNGARAAAIMTAKAHGDDERATRLKSFQFRNARAKAGTEIEKVGHTSKLPAHSSEALTKRVYRRRGERVARTR